jgi:hypothetical protein
MLEDAEKPKSAIP